MAKINLEDLLPEVRRVNVGRGEVDVYGIGLADLAPIVLAHGEVLKQFFTAETPDFMGLATVAPDVVLQLIAKGIRIDDIEQVRRIPLTAQIDILINIWEVSVPDPKALTAKLQELLVMVQQPKG